MDVKILKVVIRGREGLVFQGECSSASSFNRIGKFDILGKHANFITLIEKEIALKTVEGDERNIAVDNGLCKVTQNQVNIYLGVRQAIGGA